MPRIQVRIYRTRDGKVPLLDWLDKLQQKIRLKCEVRIMRLKDQGHELVQNRKEAAHLRDGSYELRVKRQNVNYRMLYFFSGKRVAVLSHGLTKEDKVSS